MSLSVNETISIKANNITLRISVQERLKSIHPLGHFELIFIKLHIISKQIWKLDLFVLIFYDV